MLLKKSNGLKWVVPGGVQSSGEPFRTLAVRELQEKTKILHPADQLIWIDTLAGEERHKTYPNGDEVFNNTT